MNRDALYKEITSLERKVNLLIAEHSRLKEQVDHKDHENEALRSKLESHESQLSSFQSKYNSSKIVGNAVVGKEDTEEMKKVLDGYIREIDKCIAHLGEA